jgi:acyl-CoA synthetase (AMP-forming)/AMP-acid ligase II
MAVPLFHITALCPVGLFSIPAGSKIVMMRKWDAGKALDAIENEKVTRFTGVPTMMRDLMEHPAFSPERCASLKGVAAGGAPVPPSQVAQMRKKTKKIQSAQGYGLTETMALATINKGADYLRHPTSCGKPVPLIVEVAIIDPNTKAKVPDGQRGEVCIKGAMVMKGYNNLPKKTAEAIDENGYFHTGDIGKMEAGFVYILDRMKDLIIRGGENIDCSEVEVRLSLFCSAVFLLFPCALRPPFPPRRTAGRTRLLRTVLWVREEASTPPSHRSLTPHPLPLRRQAALCLHPSVRECCVFGLPDERLGEVVGAAIWCTDSSASKADIIAASASTLAKFKVPLAMNIFMHAEELPKGPTGKLDKKGLRAKYGAVVKARAPAAKL